MVEWIARTYGWTLRHILWELPALQASWLFRCYSQGVGGLGSGTLLEDELAFARWGKHP